MKNFKKELLNQKIAYLSLTLQSLDMVNKYKAKSQMVKNIMYDNLKIFIDLLNEYEYLIDYYISLKKLLNEEIYDNIDILIKENIYEVIEYYKEIFENYIIFFEKNDMSYLEEEDTLFNEVIGLVRDEIENNIFYKYDVKTFLKENCKDIYFINEDIIDSLNVEGHNYNLDNRLIEIEKYLKGCYLFYCYTNHLNLDLDSIEEIILNIKEKYLDLVGIKKENKILRKKIGD